MAFCMSSTAVRDQRLSAWRTSAVADRRRVSLRQPVYQVFILVDDDAACWCAGRPCRLPNKWRGRPCPWPGVTIALLPPSSRIVRPALADDFADAVALWQLLVAKPVECAVVESFAHGAARADDQRRWRVDVVLFADLLRDSGAGDGGQRGLAGGFQRTLSPQTAAMAAFQLQTATGKLKADRHDAQRVPARTCDALTFGCIVSRKAAAGRRQIAMSIISCTSPRPRPRSCPFQA